MYVCVVGRSGVDLISWWVEITLGATPHWVWLQISFRLLPVTQFLQILSLFFSELCRDSLFTQ